MSNPVPAVCPCCQKYSTFLQSIHSNALFNMLQKDGKFKRNYLFCDRCIGGAKIETLRLRGETKRVVISPLLSNLYHLPGPSHQLVHHQYSPISAISDEASHGASDPLNMPLGDAQAQILSMPLIAPDDNVGSRLANLRNVSPVGWTHPMMPSIMSAETREISARDLLNATLPMYGAVAPSSSPNPASETADVWEVDIDKQKPQANAQQPN